MKIAVVGTGIFGSIAAIKLKKDGHDVDLFDSKPNILQCASGINQYRLHRGYHYPRSIETARQCNGSRSFIKEFGRCVTPFWWKRYYAVANESKVSMIDYLNFMQQIGLEYDVIGFDECRELIDPAKIQGMFGVREFGFNVDALKLLILEQLHDVNLRLNESFVDSDKYERVVNATYSNINHLVPIDQRIDYQFEICEKPIVKLDDSFAEKSIVVIDGPFGCIDPYIPMNCHVLGHVEHAIHHTNVGHFPIVPPEYENCLNSEILYKVNTKIDFFLAGLKQFVPNMDRKFVHCGSMYTIRTVLPNHDHDDARPSYIIKHNDRLYSIFSGKIGSAVDIANDLVQMI